MVNLNDIRVLVRASTEDFGLRIKVGLKCSKCEQLSEWFVSDTSLDVVRRDTIGLDFTTLEVPLPTILEHTCSVDTI